VWNATDLDAAPDYIGLPGSPTIVTELGAAPIRERKREFLEGSPEEIARQLLMVIEEAV
jgi:electron transfer flavoprotein beta subunit